MGARWTPSSSSTSADDAHFLGDHNQGEERSNPSDVLKTLLLNGDDSTAAEGTASPELLAELQNWSERFTFLSIRGLRIKPPEHQEVNSIKMVVARKIVEAHLWPQIQRVLEVENAKQERQIKNSTAQFQRS